MKESLATCRAWVGGTFGDRRVRASAGRECLLTGDLGGDVVRLFVAGQRPSDRAPHSLDSELLTPFHRLKATQARINHAAMNAAPPIGVSTPSQGVPVSASA